jgi:hypothetical protein
VFAAHDSILVDLDPWRPCRIRLRSYIEEKEEEFHGNKEIREREKKGKINQAARCWPNYKKSLYTL